jgi:hypothetical protein
MWPRPVVFKPSATMTVVFTTAIAVEVTVAAAIVLTVFVVVVMWPF